MALFRFEDKVPAVGKGTYVSDSAEVIGDVQIGECCYIGPCAVLRADFGRIVIGYGSAIEDNCILHAGPDNSCDIGRYVTVGHGAVVHDARLADYASVGMGAVVSNNVEIGAWSIVGEGCVVKSGDRVPPESIVVGVPGKVVAQVSAEQKKYWNWGKEAYVDLARRCLEGLKKL